MENEGHQPTDKLDTSNPPNESKMIEANSKVFIKALVEEGIEGLIQPPTMIVEGLYYISVPGTVPQYEKSNGSKPAFAKCIWYNTRNELQSRYINLEILTEL